MDNIIAKKPDGVLHPDIQAIISRPPARLTRWGSALLFIIVLGLLTSTAFVRYAQRVSVPLKLEAPTAPVPVQLPSPVVIGQLCVRHKQIVKQGQILGYTTDGSDVDQLLSLAKALQYPAGTSLPIYTQLGSLQLPYTELNQSIRAGGQAAEPLRIALYQQVRQWLTVHAILAPATGQVSYNVLKKELPAVPRPGEPPMYILPFVPTGREVGTVFIPQSELRHISERQKVTVSFEAYPAREYGTVQGCIEQIADLPEENGSYQALVTFPNGLQTSTKHRLLFRTGMNATAEMVIAYKPLIHHLFPLLVKSSSVGTN
jgi:multidrug efflux pump subunit AcrA (membrane-fusion protein)